MVTRKQNQQAPPPPMGRLESFRKSVRNGVRRRLARGDLSTFIIVVLLLIMPVLAMDAADWTDGMRPLIGVVILSAALGYILAWSRLSEGFALFISLFYGTLIICTTLILTTATGDNIPERIVDFITRLTDWVQVIANGGNGEDNLPFVLFFAILFWMLGHNTTWHVFRIDRVWRAVVPPGLVLLGNQFFYLNDANLELYLIPYVFLSMLLVVRSHVDAREYEWYRNRVRYPRNMRRYFLRTGAVIALLVVSVAWILPSTEDDDNLDRFNAFLESISDLGELWERLFSDLNPQGVSSAEYYGGDRLELGGAIQLGEQVVLEVQAPPNRRYYWRSTVFDTYLGNDGWEHNRSVRATKEDEGLQINIGPLVPGARQNVEQTFIIRLAASSLVYAAPQPVEFGLPVRVELDCVNSTGGVDTECVNQNREADASIAYALDPVLRDQRYTVVSSVSVADANSLRSAGVDYPAWVTASYLQYGTSITPRLRQLTQQIVQNATTPYDKAKAIESWLRVNIAYNESIPAPPSDQDPIDWVVFDHKQGYCNYYASAMALMLRSEGIPARLAAGFSQGTLENGRYVVEERDAHVWVEVFFPGYGWVEFEPTASEDELSREGDTNSPNPQPTITPLPTATPTIPPTNTPVAQNPLPSTPTPSPPPQEQPLIPPTPTITPSPTPIPPIDQQIPSDSDSDTVLELILNFLLILVLGLVALAGAVAFTIWWVEHRGLRGLNVVEKAYARMAIYGRWLGLRLLPFDTPDERRRALVRGVPAGEGSINEITDLYVENRFAPPQKSHGRANKDAREAWSEARMAFIRRKIQRWFRRR